MCWRRLAFLWHSLLQYLWFELDIVNRIWQIGQVRINLTSLSSRYRDLTLRRLASELQNLLQNLCAEPRIRNVALQIGQVRTV